MMLNLLLFFDDNCVTVSNDKFFKRNSRVNKIQECFAKDKILHCNNLIALYENKMHLRPLTKQNYSGLYKKKCTRFVKVVVILRLMFKADFHLKRNSKNHKYYHELHIVF